MEFSQSATLFLDLRAARLHVRRQRNRHRSEWVWRQRALRPPRNPHAFGKSRCVERDGMAAHHAPPQAAFAAVCGAKRMQGQRYARLMGKCVKRRSDVRNNLVARKVTG